MLMFVETRNSQVLCTHTQTKRFPFPSIIVQMQRNCIIIKHFVCFEYQMSFAVEWLSGKCQWLWIYYLFCWLAWHAVAIDVLDIVLTLTLTVDLIYKNNDLWTNQKLKQFAIEESKQFSLWAWASSSGPLQLISSIWRNIFRSLWSEMFLHFIFIAFVWHVLVCTYFRKSEFVGSPRSRHPFLWDRH